MVNSAKEGKIESIRLVKAEDLPESTKRTFSLPDSGFVEIYIESNSDPEPKRGLPYTYDQFKAFREELKRGGFLR